MTTAVRITSLKRTLSKVQSRTREVREFTRPGQTLQARRAWDHIRSLSAEIRRLEQTTWRAAIPSWRETVPRGP